GEVASRVAIADAKAIDAGIQAAADSNDEMRRLPPYARQAILQHCAKRFEERFDELAMSLCIEAGKPIHDARGEVTRLIDTFRIAAEESVRISGEVMNLEISPRAKGYRGTDRSLFVHFSLQLSTEPGSPQNRSRIGSWLPIRTQTSKSHPDRCAHDR
ncbi:MAG: aldehyde dehydrogenase family protein, partial [Rubripirellula sp.]